VSERDWFDWDVGWKTKEEKKCTWQNMEKQTGLQSVHHPVFCYGNFKLAYYPDLIGNSFFTTYLYFSFVINSNFHHEEKKDTDIQFV